MYVGGNGPRFTVWNIIPSDMVETDRHTTPPKNMSVPKGSMSPDTDPSEFPYERKKSIRYTRYKSDSSLNSSTAVPYASSPDTPSESYVPDIEYSYPPL